MTDEDPTQRYDVPPAAGVPPVPPAPPASEAALPPAPPAPAGAPPAPAMFAADPAGARTTPVITEPVTVTPQARQGRGWFKWAIAAVVVVLVAGTTFAATRLLTGDSGSADVLAWTPADSIMYAELRLDLPGDQQAEMAELMAAFPGFDDQAAFPTKLNEALDQLLSRSTEGKVGYQADIAPWFGGQLASSVGDLPEPTNPMNVRALLLASTIDAAKAEAWAAGMLSESGAATGTETYGDVTITTVTPEIGAGVVEAPQLGYAVYGDVLALGDTASIKASIDTDGKTGLDSDPQFEQATTGITGDRLGLLYVQTLEIMKASAAASEGLGTGSPLSQAYLDQVPPWTVAVLRAEDSAFVTEVRQPHVGSVTATAAESKIPSLVPADTLLLIDLHDFGKTVLQTKEQLAADPLLAEGMRQVDDALAIVGGLEAVAGWMGETGVVVTPDGEPVGGGVVSVPTDRAAAERLLTQLRGFLLLAGGGSGITVTDEPYAGTTITIVDIGDLVGQAAGGMTGLPSNVQIAYAVTDQLVVIGYGVDFVKGVLDAAAGESLADTARFKDALARADAANSALFWVDIAGARTLTESLAQPVAPADAWAQYESDLKPYVEPFDVMISTSAPGEAFDTSTLVITVVGR